MGVFIGSCTISLLLFITLFIVFTDIWWKGMSDTNTSTIS